MKKVGFFLFLLTLAGGMISTADTGETENKEEKKAVLTERTYQRLVAIHRLIEEEKTSEAIQHLDALLPEVEGDSYAAAVVHQTYGYAYVGIEAYPKAIDSFEAALALDALPGTPARRILYDLAQLYTATEDYAQGIAAIERWLIEAPDPPPGAHVLAASGYIQLKRFPNAISHLRRAIALSPTPKEGWYQSLLALYYELSEYREAARLLETIISHFPEKPIYWNQLSSLYMTLKEDEKALAILELAYMKGLLQEKEIVLLANLYLYQEVPYKAGIVLEQGLKEGIIASTKENWKRLSDAWGRAKEPNRAVAALQEAAELSREGDLDIKRGALLVELGRWEEAIEALETGILKGGIKDEGQGYLLLGIARNEGGDRRGAIASFKSAIGSPGTNRSAAQWLTYLQGEKAPE
ncbi:MAG: tetratricopeptide repeat protein [Nitrospiria bacterium]